MFDVVLVVGRGGGGGGGGGGEEWMKTDVWSQTTH